MLDTLLGQCCFLNGTLGLTESLDVRYRGSVPLHREVPARPPRLCSADDLRISRGAVQGTAVLMRAAVLKVEQHKVYIEGELSDGASGQVYATAKGLFIMSAALPLRSPEMIATLNRSTLVESARPRVVPIGPPPAAILSVPRTATAAAMLQQDCGWALDNQRIESPASAAAYAKHGLSQYVKGSHRLRQDCCWHAPTKSFVVVYAFYRHCMGPPGLVHGGCLFACLDDAITRLLFSRAVTDLGAKGGLMLTASMQLDFKAGVKLDAEYCVDVRIADVAHDRKGRRRYTITAALRDPATCAETGAEHEARVVGSAVFVETPTPWAGQIGGLAPAAAL
jgi:acyl-coenzyme A thioesterase PaaI-like protein